MMASLDNATERTKIKIEPVMSLSRLSHHFLYKIYRLVKILFIAIIRSRSADETVYTPF